MGSTQGRRCGSNTAWSARTQFALWIQRLAIHWTVISGARPSR
jgi:hypothetical protein